MLVQSALKTVDLLNQIDMLKYKREMVGSFLDEVTDQISGKLYGITAWAKTLADKEIDDEAKSAVQKIDDYVIQADNVIKAICFNTPKSRSVSELFEFVKILNKHRTSEVHMNIKYNVDEEVEFAYYRNSVLIYLLVEIVTYIRRKERAKRATESSGDINIRNIMFTSEITEKALNVVVSNEFGHDYDETILAKLNSIVAEEPEGFIEISTNEKDLTIKFSNLERISEDLITVGKRFNDEITKHGVE